MRERIRYYFLTVIGSVLVLLSAERVGACALTRMASSNDVLYGQGSKATVVQNDAGDSDSPAKLFKSIEEGIAAGNIRTISNYFDKQVNLNLRSLENGYYSANQTYVILQNYFSSRKIVSFKFTSRSMDEGSPYATGGATVRTKGTNEIVQIFIALTRVDHRWVIRQFNIY